MDGVSIITCSRFKDLKNKLKDNINKTVGIDYELIVLDNSENKYSIFSAYNEGANRAKYSYLCFIHDDILFHTENWGKKVIEHFKNPKVGVIGVAGSHYVPKLPGSYWISGIASMNVIHTINGETHIDSLKYVKDKSIFVNAVVLDGLWLCIPRFIMDQARFDDIIFSGFHCYDYDICMQIRKLNYDVKIVFDIVIEHFSSGERDFKWLKNSFSFFDKWEAYLPVTSLEISKSEKARADFINAKDMIENIKINKFGFLYILKIWYYYLKSDFQFNKRNLISILKLLKSTLLLHLS
jgi:hypothetical protein